MNLNKVKIKVIARNVKFIINRVKKIKVIVKKIHELSWSKKIKHI